MNQPKTPSVVYNNQRIAIGKDLVFSWVVWTEEGWTPLSHGDLEELLHVKREMDYNPIFPPELNAYVSELIEAQRAKAS